MAIVFDTLGFANRLRDAGVPAKQAEGHANAVKDFIMLDLVTKADLANALEAQTLRLTIRLGGLLVVGIGALALLIKLP